MQSVQERTTGNGNVGFENLLKFGDPSINAEIIDSEFLIDCQRNLNNVRKKKEMNSNPKAQKNNGNKVNAAELS